MAVGSALVPVALPTEGVLPPSESRVRVSNVFSLLSLLLLWFLAAHCLLSCPLSPPFLFASVLLRWLRCCSSVWQPSYFWGVPWVWRGASIRGSPSLYKPSGLDGRQSVRRGHRGGQRGRIRVSPGGGRCGRPGALGLRRTSLRSPREKARFFRPDSAGPVRGGEPWWAEPCAPAGARWWVRGGKTVLPGLLGDQGCPSCCRFCSEMLNEPSSPGSSPQVGVRWATVLEQALLCPLLPCSPPERGVGRSTAPRAGFPTRH